MSNFGSIRLTEDGEVSIFDLIRVCSNSPSRTYPANTWKRLTSRHTELLSSKCTHIKKHKFPGKGQRITPICDRETALKIIGLLPGEAGKKYRDIASKLVLEYLQDPEALANRATDRMEQLGDLKGLQDHQKRTEGKIKRLELTDELKSRGVTKFYHFANITNGMTKDVLSKTATQIKKEHKVKNARDVMTDFELSLISASESLARALMIKQDAQGYKECNDQSRKASKTIKNVIEE